MIVWFRRFADIPGVDFRGTSGVDRRKLPGTRCRARDLCLRVCPHIDKRLNGNFIPSGHRDPVWLVSGDRSEFGPNMREGELVFRRMNSPLIRQAAASGARLGATTC